MLPPALNADAHWPIAEFLLGLNLPWLRYGCDFGANAWHPEGGLSRPAQRLALDVALARVADAGISTVRWFLLCDGRAGITERGTGGALGLDARVLGDLDVALAALSRHRLQVMFVVLDFSWCDPPRVVHGVALGGRSATLLDGTARAGLIEGVIAPLVSHCAGHDAVFAWDLMNEPDVLAGRLRHVAGRSVATREALSRALDDLCTAVRAHAPQPITVGVANLAGLELVRGLGLDFYQVHWYDRFGLDTVVSQEVASLGLDRPIVLGEYPTRNTVIGPATIVASARRLGYAGAFAWSLLAGDSASSGAPTNPLRVGPP